MASSMKDTGDRLTGCVICMRCSSYTDNHDLLLKRGKEGKILELQIFPETFYSNLDVSDWVICPLVGELIERDDLEKQDITKLHNVYQHYCTTSEPIQTSTPLCLQDPFDHSHNITRGLKHEALQNFKNKCTTSAEICTQIINGQLPLGELFEYIEPGEALLNNSLLNSSANISQEEIDLVSDTSQDNIDETDGFKQPQELDEIVFLEEFDKNQTIPLIELDKSSDDMSKNKESETVKEIDKTKLVNETNGYTYSNTILVEPDCYDDPENAVNKFTLSLAVVKEFSILPNGAITIGSRVFTLSEMALKACEILEFALKYSLKMNIESKSADNNIDNLSSRKRKDSSTSNDFNKKLKVDDGSCSNVIKKYTKLSQFLCSTSFELWIGRKKVSRQIPQIDQSPLQHELSVTSSQLSSFSENTTKSGNLKVLITIWQKESAPNILLVTCKSMTNDKQSINKTSQMFPYLASLSYNLLRRTLHYVNTSKTVSKI